MIIEEIEQLQQEGNKHEKKGLIQKAIEKYETAKKKVDCSNYYFITLSLNLASVYNKQHKYEKSLQEIEDLKKNTVINIKDEDNKKLNTIHIKALNGRGKEHYKNNDDLLAFSLFNRAMMEGSIAAIRYIGLFYEQGRGVSKDYFTAAGYYQKALAKGNAKEKQAASKSLNRLLTADDINGDDLCAIGTQYYMGNNGIEKNYGEAKRWFEKGIEKKHGKTYWSLATGYRAGKFDEKNNVLAAKYFQQAIDNGYLQAQTDLDQLLKDNDINYEDLNNIGILYYVGDGIKKNYDQAIKFFLAAIEEDPNNYWAFTNVGLCYSYIKSLEKSNILAAKYFQQAIEKGCPDSEKYLNEILQSKNITGKQLNKIGCMYYKGKEVNQDYKKANILFKNAGEKEEGVGYYNLALSYMNGDGVEEDYVEGSNIFS